jgi:hypothetical protein
VKARFHRRLSKGEKAAKRRTIPVVSPDVALEFRRIADDKKRMADLIGSFKGKIKIKGRILSTGVKWGVEP